MNHGITLERLTRACPDFKPLLDDPAVVQRIEIEALYRCAIQDQAEEIAEVRRDEAMTIPVDLDYNSEALNIGFEDREKLLAIQPQTVCIN